MMLQQVVHDGLNGWTVDVRFGLRMQLIRSRWTHVRSFCSYEFCVCEQRPVLQIVDSQTYRLSIGYRTKMPGHFVPMTMRFRNRSAQFGAGDMHVRFERCNPLLRPEGHCFSGILGTFQLMHLGKHSSLSFQIGAG